MIEKRKPLIRYEHYRYSHLGISHCRKICQIPGSGRSPGKGTGNPLQYSYLENSMDRGAWKARVQGAAKYISAYTWNLEKWYAAAKPLQSCSTLCDPIDGSPPGSPVPGILQERTLEWIAISFSNA